MSQQRFYFIDYCVVYTTTNFILRCVVPYCVQVETSIKKCILYTEFYVQMMSSKPARNM